MEENIRVQLWFLSEKWYFSAKNPKKDKRKQKSHENM